MQSCRLVRDFAASIHKVGMSMKADKNLGHKSQFVAAHVCLSTVESLYNTPFYNTMWI